MEKLLGLRHDEILKIPDRERHVLHLLFDEEYPVYKCFANSAVMWDYTAKLNIYGYKYSNLLYSNENWYETRVATLKELPKFSELWDEVQIDRPIIMESHGHKPIFPTYSTEI